MNYSKTHVDFTQLPEWITPLKKALKLTGVALSVIRIPKGKGYSFLHSHRAQEEVYLILSGEGLIHLDGADVPLRSGDLVRVSPEAKRALKSSETNDLILLCAGGIPSETQTDQESTYLFEDGIPDFDDLPPWYRGNQKIIELNQQIKRRRESQKKNS